MCTPDSDATTRLLDRARRGDSQALGLLLDRYRDETRRLVQLRIDPLLRSRADESDIVQETQIDAARRFEDYLTRRPMPFRIWLRRTALQRLSKIRRQHLDVSKRSVQRELHLSDDASQQLYLQLIDSGSSPSKVAMKRELKKQLRDALSELSNTDREILLMRHVERMSNLEIAQSLDLSESAVSKRHYRSLIKLGAILKQYGIHPSDK